MLILSLSPFTLSLSSLRFRVVVKSLAQPAVVLPESTPGVSFEDWGSWTSFVFDHSIFEVFFWPSVVVLAAKPAQACTLKKTRVRSEGLSNLASGLLRARPTNAERKLNS